MAKASHLAVDYRDGTAQRRCASCTMYEPAHSRDEDPRPHCAAVKDPIRPGGVCDLYRRQA